MSNPFPAETLIFYHPIESYTWLFKTHRKRAMFTGLHLTLLNLPLDPLRNVSSSSDCISLCVLLHFMEENCQPLTLPLLFSGQHSRNSNPTPSLPWHLSQLKPAHSPGDPDTGPTPEHPQGTKSSLGDFPFTPYRDQPNPAMDRGNLPNPAGTAAAAQGAPGTGGPVTHGNR